ncbi:MAG: SDR family oxidoreductase [Deltaproteobacteria bacterium]|nr:MAG: SDR family oxidoreductase [Deltaproteobacteria bacterium]
METGLAGRTVIVTGATANIGRGVALAFAAEGANVVVVGRDEAQGARVVGRDEAQGARVCDDLRARGAKAVLWQRADVSDLAQVDGMVSAVRAEFAAVDVLVNNVGGNVDVDAFVDSDPQTWNRDIALNIGSNLNCTQAVLPGMIDRSYGRIINIGSTAGLIGDPMLAVYSAMKGAVHAFTKVLAIEVGKSGITVNAIAPYGTLPDDPARDVSSGSRWHRDGVFARVAATRPEQLHAIGRRTVMQRQTAFPAEIGAAAVYLASDAAAFVTGHVLAVDGGVLLA